MHAASSTYVVNVLGNETVYRWLADTCPCCNYNLKLAIAPEDDINIHTWIAMDLAGPFVKLGQAIEKKTMNLLLMHAMCVTQIKGQYFFVRISDL